jgi:hypothetical protein
MHNAAPHDTGRRYILACMMHPVYGAIHMHSQRGLCNDTISTRPRCKEPIWGTSPPSPLSIAPKARAQKDQGGDGEGEKYRKRDCSRSATIFADESPLSIAERMPHSVRSIGDGEGPGVRHLPDARGACARARGRARAARATDHRLRRIRSGAGRSPRPARRRGADRRASCSTR